MKDGTLVRLSCPISSLNDAREYLLSAARNKSVLNVGAAGGVDRYLPSYLDQWPHHAFAEVAREIEGIDIDEEGIRHAAQHGTSITLANCETCDLGRFYDVIVMSDVIEHVASPTRAVTNLARHLAPGGHLLITTPNGTSLNALRTTMLRRPPSVYYDHMQIFYPEHIQAICDRHRLTLEEVFLFTNHDQRTRGFRARSIVIRGVGLLLPRLSQSFLAVIRQKPHTS
ncbi:class I SAM-dependent methyltransferase [Rhodopseudomonas palustris]|uniref:class I SAM-dependent methyltransferase n=1 Tax=Rhodopseudomonas palustris TaxID=1076 RepID=UPI0022F0D046|nr:class I SAM-dependent methyltransferase [Rhodopseudomonas palustris]WBU31257.1 class I SAM-dependent methyltransferase [Rhodopseudomonas palustris]